MLLIVDIRHIINIVYIEKGGNSGERIVNNRPIDRAYDI